MKNSIILITLLCISIPVNAENVYVTDSIKFTIKKSGDKKSKVIKMVSSGTRLTKISDNPTTGYSLVRTKKGLEGYIPTRHLSKNPISKWFLQQTQKELELLKDELKQLKSGKSESNVDLTNLQKTADEAIQLKFKKNQLQEQVSSVKRELEQVKRDNQILEHSERQDWFLYGGLLSLFGVILGFLLPKLGWSRKKSSWDKF